MMSFTTREITTDSTVGDKLRHARQTMLLSYAAVEKFTNIPQRTLGALENGAYEHFSGEVYVRQFLKKYAEFLGIDTSYIFGLYERERNAFSFQSDGSSRMVYGSVRQLPRTYFLITPKIIRWLAFSFAALLLVFYLGSKVVTIAAPPMLEVKNPEDNLVTSQRFVWVEGKTQKEAVLRINNHEVLSDPNGFFKEGIDLSNGLNIITVSAKKKYGREREVLRKVLVVAERNPLSLLRK